MEINEYQKLALKTINKELDKKEILINSVMGLCGEAGEAIDLVKKHIFHNQEFKKDEFIKELGDVAWYIAEACFAVDVSLEDVLKNNIEKLKKRYPNGFNKEDSILRKDEKEV